MPTYLNTSESAITVLNETLQPGKRTQSFTWLSSLPNGIIILEKYPMYNPLIICEKIEKDTEITIPPNEKRFGIHLYCKAGEVKVFYDDIKNSPCLILTAGEKWNTRYYERILNKLIIKFESSDNPVLIVRIERI